MNSVLYTQDMEPITVINLPVEVHNFEFLYMEYKVAVPMFPDTVAMTDSTPVPNTFRTVSVYTEKFMRHGKEYPMFFTDDDELALLLKPETLPGQVKVYNDKFREVFTRGLIAALGIL